MARLDLGDGRRNLRVMRDRRDLKGRELQRWSRESVERGDRRCPGREGGGNRNDVADYEGEGTQRDEPERNAPTPKRQEAELVSRNHSAVQTVWGDAPLPLSRWPPSRPRCRGE